VEGIGSIDDRKVQFEIERAVAALVGMEAAATLPLSGAGKLGLYLPGEKTIAQSAPWNACTIDLCTLFIPNSG